MSLGKSLCAGAVLVALISTPVRAALEFGRTSDSLYIQGSTPLGNQATIEAVVKLQLPPLGLDGRIFNELAGGYMDVDLGVDSSGLWGYMFPPSVGYAIANVPVSPTDWHHVAFEYDGASVRMYLDGQLVQSNSAAGVIGTSPTSIAAIGAYFRDSHIDPSFIGDIQSFRISDTARYAGTSFTPTLGDLTSDANTLLLYNFDTPSNLSTVLVPDLSGHQRTGVIGIGFVGATSPQWVVPEPLMLPVVLTAGAAVLTFRRRSA